MGGIKNQSIRHIFTAIQRGGGSLGFAVISGFSKAKSSGVNLLIKLTHIRLTRGDVEVLKKHPGGQLE